MNRYLVWLNWPEKCFRADAGALRYLKTLVPESSVVKSVQAERAFLRELPFSTHAIVWNFKREWFALAPKLKLLATPAAGRELVPTSGPDGVTIHFGGFHGNIIAENVAGFMLAWSRGFFRHELSTAAPWHESWPRAAIGGVCSLVSGTTAAIVGYGKIGKAIGEKLKALGVTVYGFGRKNLADFPAVAKSADWLILALPSDTGTDNFLDAKTIRKLPRKCVVVNIGRGNAIDESDLLAALKSGRLAGAYLDVFQGEPGPLDKGERFPILGTAPAELPPNLIMTPHSSAFCDSYVKMCFDELMVEGLL